jgi:hypothetical protein
MLKSGVLSSLLAFSNPSFAPDEHRSSTQQNAWSADEPHQENRCKEPSFFA